MEIGVRLTVVGDGMEADVVCGLLRSSGIECSQRQTDTAIGAWDPTGAGGPREILVAADDLDAARAILNARPE
jgi:hypothetical protein